MQSLSLPDRNLLYFLVQYNELTSPCSTDVAIMCWFCRRRDFESRSPENLDLDEQMRTITYRSPEAEGLFSDQRIRKDAFEYLERHGKMETLLYEEGAFFSVLIHDLRHMAKRRRKGRRFFPHVSFLSDHDIVFGG